MSEHTRAFKRGGQWNRRRRELRERGMLTRKQLGIVEGHIRAGLEVRRMGMERPADKDVARLLTDWLIIYEELEGE